MVSGIVSGTGGPDCIECHDIANTTTGYNVSVSAMNQSDNIHASLNINMKTIANSTSSANNSICWGCHVSGGSVPPAGYDCSNAIPYNCYECHNGTVAYTNVSSAPVVKEHFKSGENITAMADADTNSTSCVQCHNLAEMKQSYSEPDANYNASSLASHYGKKRELGSDDAYCNYCHNNNSNVFEQPTQITEPHTDKKTLNCNNPFCHNTGGIHDSSLNKKMRCVDCHTEANTITTTNITDEIDRGYRNPDTGDSFMVVGGTENSSTLAPYGSNMTHKRDTIATTLGSDPPSTSGKEMYARHANPNSNGGWPGAIGMARDEYQNMICINCHTNRIRGMGEKQEDEWELFKCTPCHEIFYEGGEMSDFQQPNAHRLSKPYCSDCHALLTGNPGWPDIHLYFDAPEPPKKYGRVPSIGIMLDMSGNVHKNMILNTTTNHPTNVDGCLVCHTNVTFTLNYSTANELSVEITDHSGAHIWNSNPDCTKCHSSDVDYWVGKPKEHGESGNNIQCLECHNSSTKIKARPPGYEYQHGHDVQNGKAGPNCISCHDQNGAIALINVSAISEGIHSGIQDYTTIGDGVVGKKDWKGDTINKTNRICWACHMDDGNFTAGPTSMDHADKLKFDTSPGPSDDDPYTCYGCHNSTSKPYDCEEAKWWNVTEHFYSGDDLKAGINGTSDNDGSCLICHNKSFMRITSGFESSNSNFSLVSHYGKNRSDLRTLDGGNTVNCSYCHNSLGTDSFNDIMINPAFNASVPAHSLNADKFSSVSPNCTDSKCHVGGWMHNKSLAKPELTTSTPDSVVCLSCHGANSSGGANWTGLKTGVKDKHSGTLNCTECHLYVKQDIHSVKYLQKDDTYSMSNSSAVDCIRCHNDGTDLNNISMFRPLVPTNSNLNFAHSEDPDNGSRWNETSYWDSVEGACDYCHGDTKHNDSALGPIEFIQGSNVRNSTIDASSYWCSGCHYQEADNYHSVGNWTMIPPTIYYNNTGLLNATDDVNVSWYNHTLLDFSDRSCRACHGALLSNNPTTAEFAHNAAEGEFGPDCISCHDVNRGSPKINFSVVNDSLSIHQNISTYDSIPDVVGVNDTNKICWACHMNDSKYTDLKEEAHADRLGDYNGVPVYTCDECHVDNNAASPSIMPDSVLVKEHFYGGANLTAGNSTDNLTSCEVCHNLGEMKLDVTLDNTPGGTDPEDQSDASYLIAHYGKKRDLRTWNGGVNCSYCHQNNSNAFAISSIMANPILNAIFTATFSYFMHEFSGGWASR